MSLCQCDQCPNIFDSSQEGQMIDGEWWCDNCIERLGEDIQETLDNDPGYQKWLSTVQRSTLNDLL